MRFISKKANVSGFRLLFRRKIILLITFFLLGNYIIIFIDENIKITQWQKLAEKKYNEFYNVELVHDKPWNQFVAHPKGVWVYTLQGEKLGQLMNTPIVYSSNKKVDGEDYLKIEIYGWIWEESIDESGNLLVQENIRYWANSHIISKLNTGIRVNKIYTNELQSWTLINCSAIAPADSFLTPEEFKNIPGIKRFVSNLNLKYVNTKRTGGVSVKPATRPVVFKFEDFIWQVRVILSLFLIISISWLLLKFYIPEGYPNKRKRRMNALIFLLSGIITGSIIQLF